MATLAATNKPKENPTGKPSFKKAPPLLPAAYKAIPDDKLQDILWEWNPDLLVETLVVHYKNADTCTRLRSTEHPRFPKRLAEMLHVCSDPPAFVLDFLVSLSTRFSRNDPATSPRFEKLLARMCVEALEKYAYDLAIPEKETEAGATTNEAGEAGMKIDGADPTLSDVDMGIDTMTSLFDITDDIFNNPKTSPNFNIVTRPPTGIITPAHQHRCLSLIPTIASPALIYIAMVPFCLKPLLSAPAADGSEPVGVALIRRLFDHSNHYEAIAAVRALGLGGYFSITQMAVPLLEANNLQQVIVFCEGDEKKTEFLEFVNGQLAILFVGGVKIVPDDMLASVSPAVRALPPMRRLADRRFQKDITSAAARILYDDTSRVPSPTAYPFIDLARHYACLRWLLRQRAAQQEIEGDRTPTATANFDGMIERLAKGNPAIAKLTVRKLIDMDDDEGARWFASLLGVQPFYDAYVCLSPEARVLGSVVDPAVAITRAQAPSRRHGRRNTRRATVAAGLPRYAMPEEVEVRFVTSREGLVGLRDTLREARVCGLDTEWLPQFLMADRMPQCTAVMQIACDTGTVFLLDMIALKGKEAEGGTIGGGEGTKSEQPDGGIREETERVLKEFFKDEGVLKIGYEFHGDQVLLSRSFPAFSPSTTPLRNFLDFKYVHGVVDDHKEEEEVDAPDSSVTKALGGRISGGLAGLVGHYLKVQLDKKQQLSDWEKRPLSEEQKAYAASDAYSLLEIYRVLLAEEHPILATAMKDPPENKHGSNNDEAGASSKKINRTGKSKWRGKRPEKRE